MKRSILMLGLFPVLLQTACNDSGTDPGVTETDTGGAVFFGESPSDNAGLTVFDDRSLFDSVVGADQLVQDFEAFALGEVCPITDPPRTSPCELVTDTVTYTSTKSDPSAEQGSEGIRLTIGNMGASIYGNGIYVPAPIPGEPNDFFLTLASDFVGFDLMSGANSNSSLPEPVLTVQVMESDGTSTELTVPAQSYEGAFIGLVSEVGILSVTVWDSYDDGRASNFSLDNVAVQVLDDL